MIVAAAGSVAASAYKGEAASDLQSVSLMGRHFRSAMPLITILVEDNPTIRDNLVPAMTELAGLSVIATADTAGGAIEALQEHREAWQLVVVDLFLKQGSGLTVIRACQGRQSFQHVLVLTNYATKEMRQRCLALGADGIFDKSTELEMFFAQCNAYQAG